MKFLPISPFHRDNRENEVTREIATTVSLLGLPNLYNLQTCLIRIIDSARWILQGAKRSIQFCKVSIFPHDPNPLAGSGLIESKNA